MLVRIHSLCARLLLPRAFVREFGAELAADVAARLAAAPGTGTRCVILIRELIDLVRTGVREHGLSLRARRAALASRGGSRRSTNARAVLSGLARDVRHSLWQIRRAPGFALLVALTLALGIGANTAIFTVVRGVLLQPLPYGDPASLVALHETVDGAGSERLPLSPPNYVDYRAGQHTLSDIAAYTAGSATWRPEAGDPVVVRTVTATANVFAVLAVPPLHGRTFAREGREDGVVVSHAFWRGALGGDASAIGRRLVLDDRSYELIGVMPPGFTLGLAEDLWLATDLADELADAPRTRKQHYLHVIGRLAGGTSLTAARAEAELVGARLEAEYPRANTGRRPLLLPLHGARTGELRAPLLLLQGAAALVLVIACANLANLMVARTAGRREELAVRVALGAGRPHIIRQLLVEAVVIACIGGILGVAIAAIGTRLLLASNADLLPMLFTVRIDGGVLAFACGVSILTGLAFGLAPAVSGMPASVSGILRDGGRGAVGRRSGRRTRNTLVVVQVGLAVMLVVGVAMLAQSFHRLTNVRAGFDPTDVLTAQVALGGPRYENGTAVNAFYDGVLEAIAASPGVLAAGAAIAVPLDGAVSSTLGIEGESFDPLRPHEIGYVMVRGDYFGALRVPLVEGRLFDERDRADGPKTVVLNQAAVRRYFPDGQAIGRRVRFGPDQSGPWSTVIGVVGDVRDEALDLPARPAVYVNHRQETWYRSLALVIRTEGPAEGAAPAIRHAVRSQDPTIGVRDIASLENVLGSTLAPRRFALALAGSFGGLALVLAATGIHGVLTLAVGSRERELGVRRALGANSIAIAADVLRDVLAWSALGVVIGIGGAAGGSRLLEGMLFGVTALDAGVYAVAVLVVLLGAGIAAAIPVLRAIRVDPLTSMRAD